MKVVITGGCGFVGQCLAREILRRGSLIGPKGKAEVDSIVLADIARPAQWVSSDLDDPRIKVEVCDVTNPETARNLIDTDDLSFFYLSAIMSGQGETDFDLCYAVNFDGVKSVLECLRARDSRPKFLMASTMACFSGGADLVVNDDLRAVPETTYGASKRMGELLLNDYSRKGFVDGRACRLPTVIVRAGAPNAATTGAFSGVIREPLAGVDIELPLRGDITHSMTGYRNVVANMLKLHEAPETTMAKLGLDRTINLPALECSLDELVSALHDVTSTAGDDGGVTARLGNISFNVDEKLSNLVDGFPKTVDASRGETVLGFEPVPDVATLIRDYIQDFPEACSVLAGAEVASL